MSVSKIWKKIDNMGLFKKVGHAISQPFKEIGSGWWDDVRGPLVGAVIGGIPGALIGSFAQSQHEMKKAAAQQEAMAQQELQASYAQTVQGTLAPQSSVQNAVADTNDATARRRAYTMNRTVMPRTLGRLGGRITLG